MKLRMFRLLIQYVAAYHLAMFMGGTLLAVTGVVGIFMDQPGPPQPIDAVLESSIGTGSFVAVLVLGSVLVLLALVRAALRMAVDLDASLRETDAAENKGAV